MMLALRQRMIAAQLRQARNDAGYSMRQLAEMIDMPVSRISTYERGLRPVPIPDLESLLDVLDSTLDSLIDRGGPVGAWLEEKLAFEHFRELPDDLRTFFNTPGHEPYLRMAVRLSQLDLADLRAVSDALQDLLP
jgi:transcriptional regulator with XRE-family HTH domain